MHLAKSGHTFSIFHTSCSDKHDAELDDFQHGDKERLWYGVLLGLAEVPHAVVAHLLQEIA